MEKFITYTEEHNLVLQGIEIKSMIRLFIESNSKKYFDGTIDIPADAVIRAKSGSASVKLDRIEIKWKKERTIPDENHS